MTGKSAIGRVLLGLSLLVLLATGVQYFREQQRIEDLRNKVEAEEAGEETPVDEDGVMLSKFRQLYGENNDLVGWIQIPGTVIDYPVLQFMDNVFYLERNFYGEKHKAGSIFMDYRNGSEAEDFNTILYGHHMADGSMFKDLMKYKKEDFFREHPTIKFDILNKEYEWEIFSIYVTDVEFYYIDTNFPTEEKKLDFIRSIRERTLYETDISVGPEDHILTLSTCTYEFDNARFVVHAKRVDPKNNPPKSAD